MQREPPPFVWAAPDEKDILTCTLIVTVGRGTNADYPCRELHHRGSHQYIMLPHGLTSLQRGPPDSPYTGGEYHGVLLFPSEYPFKPPGIKVRLVINYRAVWYTHAGVWLCNCRCTRLQAASSLTSASASQCLTSILALYVAIAQIGRAVS